MKTTTTADVKFGFTDLSDLVANLEQLTKFRAEHERVEKMQSELAAERTRLFGTGEFEDADVLKDLSAIQLKLDLVPAKLEQLAKREAELEAAMKAEATARHNDVFREAGAILEQHKAQIGDMVATLMPRSVPVPGHAGRDTQYFNRAVLGLMEHTEVFRLLVAARQPISYSFTAKDAADHVQRAARLVVAAKKLLGSKQELREHLEVA
jgi:hypothetical protein